MKIVNKNLLSHLIYLFIRRAYISSFWRVPGAMSPIDHPHTIEIALTNDCNLSCVHCHRRKTDRKIGYMEMPVYTKLIDEIANYRTSFLRLVGQGESALHPKFGEMMQYAVNKSIKIELVTNGVVFDLYSVDAILQWDIDILGISVDGLDKVSYQEIRKGGSYDSLVSNIQKFYTSRNKAKKKYPMVVVRNVIFPDYTSQQIEEYKERWQDSADQITFNTLATFEKSATNSKDHFNRCREIFFDAHIRYDGSVLLCQHQFLYGPNEVIGNIKINNLREVWKSKRLKEIRMLHRNREFPQTCQLCLQNIKSNDVSTNARKYNSSKNKIVRVINKVINLT